VNQTEADDADVIVDTDSDDGETVFSGKCQEEERNGTRKQ
jgi:hypothetical protein